MKKLYKILGIETSCDETAAAIVNQNLEILSNIVSSQIEIHKKYGGVYPEVASRAHLENILPVISEALEKAKLNFANIDAIAVTVGPGLIGSLLIGVETAKTLAFVFDKPIIPINHLEGHIAANFIEKNSKNIEFPILNLIVSGGHTSLVLMKDFGKYKTIGSTRDDAAGEAFDKVAQLLGLPYPGGPAIEAAATKVNSKQITVNNKIKLPRPMIGSNDFDFSFSGLKTAVLQLTKNLGPKKVLQFRNEIAHEFQNAVCDVLISKTLKAAKKYKVKTIMLSGGVSANSFLRKEFACRIKNLECRINFLVPPKNLCTDNAAMIAAAGALNFSKNKLVSAPNNFGDANLDPTKITAKSNLEL